MSKPSARTEPPNPAHTAGPGSTSHTRAVGATVALLVVWALLTLAAPWLAEPVSDLAHAGWVALGLDRVTEEDAR